MGRRGPKSKTDGQARLSFVTGIPHCPPDLSADAKNEWRRVARHLHKKGLLTTLDRAGFTAYCISYGLMIRAERELTEKDSLLVTTPNGMEQQSALIGIMNQAMQRVRAWCRSFGFTPDDRGRIFVPDTEEGKVDGID